MSKLDSPVGKWEHLFGFFVVTFLAFADESIIPNQISLVVIKIACILFVALRIMAIPILGVSFELTPKTQQTRTRTAKPGRVSNSPVFYCVDIFSSASERSVTEGMVV